MKNIFKINFEQKQKNNRFFVESNGRIDKIFLLAVLLVTAYGTIMVFSAGIAYAEARYGDSLYFVKKQTIWLLIGFAVLYFSSKIEPLLYKKLTPYFYAMSTILLVLVLIVGFVGNGAQRWISIGPITIQPSEIAKLSMIMMLAKYFSDFEEKANDYKSKTNIFVYGTLIPCLIILLPTFLVMLQKHLSCIIILGTIGLLIIIISGINLRYIYGFCAIGASAVTYRAFFTDYTKERITVWQNPEAYKLTGGWQTLQGLMAIGSGGLFGVGFGQSILKHCYVSEPANDMIFAILCEELGWVGALLALSLFAFLFGRCSIIALRIDDIFAKITVIGIAIKLAVQVLLNVAVVTNSIPNTGISLPFFSYGGSSLIMLFFEMGIVLAFSRESRVYK